MEDHENRKFPRGIKRQLNVRGVLMMLRAKPARFDFLSTELFDFDLVPNFGFGFLDLNDDSHRPRRGHQTGNQGQKESGNLRCCSSEHNSIVSLELYCGLN